LLIYKVVIIVVFLITETPKGLEEGDYITAILCIVNVIIKEIFLFAVA